jgi:hypothetical protein
LEFTGPFESFVHRWGRVRNARNLEEDDDTRKHLDLLWEILIEELRVTLETRDNLLSHGVMTYDYLWTIFESKTLVFKGTGPTEDERLMSVAQAQAAQRIQASLHVWSEFVDWDGERFSMQADSTSIPRYEGTKKITELPVYPLKYHSDYIGVQKRCIAWAREWNLTASIHSSLQRESKRWFRGRQPHHSGHCY